MEEVNASVGNHKKPLVEQLNDEFTDAVLPVTVFVGIEVVLGFFGNVLVIYVFLFRYHVCNFRYFVLCLAFIDITSTLTTMPGEMVTHLYWYVYPVDEVCKVKSFFNMFTVVAEALSLLTIAIDRYRKVCQPFGWQIKPNSAKIICLIIYIVAFILALPVSFLWGISFHKKIYKGVTITTTVCETGEEYQNTKHPIEYSVTMEAILSISLIAMFVLYMFVARTLMRTKKKEPVSTAVQQASSSLTDGSSSNAVEIKEQPVCSDTGYSSSTASEQQKHQSRQRKEQSPKGIKSVSPEPTKTTTETDLSETSKEKNPSSSFALKNFSTVGYSDDGLTTDEDGGLTTDEEDSGKRQHVFSITTKRGQSRSRKSTKTCVRTKRMRRKTLIMLVLTVIFMVTTVLYLTLLSFIALPAGVLENMSHTERAVYFLFFRFYFINHVINPVVYGLLDPKFRQLLKKTKS
ncbi:uncharacterized protein LOC128546658 [Mercenaria mercenaria]|uniref:uncharacterized protein LOC128546658 n=1 Tax=Mercenaria mercenaria TaxID=6596 RepID=UPI00234EB7E6|nr:uncharacterized protein LOC128546658 [Mercenaria mercenaria]